MAGTDTDELRHTVSEPATPASKTRLRQRRKPLKRFLHAFTSLRKTGDMPVSRNADSSEEEEEEESPSKSFVESDLGKGPRREHALPDISLDLNLERRRDPDRCLHNFALPEDDQLLFARNQSGLSSTASANFIPGLNIYLKSGEHLYPCDKSGFSDPFCKLKIGKSKYKSQIIKKSLNPVWGEEFFLACAENISQPLLLEVFDKDLTGTDFMGMAEIDTSGLQLDMPIDMAVTLRDDANRNKKLPSEDIGKINLTVTRVRNASKEDAKLRKKEKGAGSRLVTVDIVEAKELPAMDENGKSDPYVKVRIGQLTKKTKVVKESLNPTFKQRLEFEVHDLSSRIIFQVYDKDRAADDIMGHCEVDLNSLKYEQTRELWMDINPADHDGRLHVFVTVCDLYGESNYEMTEEEQAQYPAALELTIIKAKALAAKDMGGTSDPFVIIEIGNTRLRTVTQKKTLAPVWDKTFHIPIQDIFDVAQLSVYDEDKGGKKEFLGALIIPILEMPQKKRVWYPLKCKRFIKRGQGELQLEFCLKYKAVPACKKLISRRVVKHMSEPDKFKLALLKLHISRVTAVIMALVNGFRIYDGIFKWSFGFVPSFFAMNMWVIACLFLDLWMFPLVLVACLGYTFVFWRKKSLGGDDDGFSQFEAEEEEEDETQESSSGGRGLKERYSQLKSIGQTIQNILDDAASTGERVKNLVNWSVPLITALVCLGLAIASVALFLIPLRYLLLFWGLKKFIKKGMNKYHPFGLMKLPKNHVPVNEPMEVIGRLPSDLDLCRWSRLPPLGGRASKRMTKSELR